MYEVLRCTTLDCHDRRRVRVYLAGFQNVWRLKVFGLRAFRLEAAGAVGRQV